MSDQELADPQFLAGVRATARALRVSPSDWLDRIYDFYRDFDGVIVDAKRNEVFLDLEVFETDHIREWFRDWICKPMAEGVRPRLRGESKERIRIIATILRAQFPFDTIQWLAANDNTPAPN
ncbi:hypothetical protein L2D01_05350 [Hyphomonadaceae bacterium ML37]|nr:hypothetical protein L2D01_05350 [Hyphomonadaceae bacterium ML37]